MLAYLFSFFAGLLTTLSPCVLPLLPFILGGTGQNAGRGALMVAAGLVSAFTVLGVVFASFGSLFGLQSDTLRLVGAAILLCMGITMLVPPLQRLLERCLSPLANLANRELATQHNAAAGSGGVWKNFALGAVLGAVWSPCIGPTLGAAIALAAQGGLAQAAFMMLLFSAGAVLPLLLAAFATRKLFSGFTRRWLGFSKYAKPAFGLIVVTIGVLLLSGGDKVIEAAILRTLPAGWNDLLTKF